LGAAAAAWLCTGCEVKRESGDGAEYETAEAFGKAETMTFDNTYFEKFAGCSRIRLDEVSDEPGVNGRSVALTADEVGKILTCLQTAGLNRDTELDYRNCDFNLWLYNADRMWLGRLGIADGRVVCSDGEVVSDTLDSLVTQLVTGYLPEEAE